MCQAAAGYVPRPWEGSLVQQLLRERLPDLLRQTGGGLPGYVETELAAAADCGSLSRGAAMFLCDGCGRRQFVPFSCKRRAACLSCSGRRMNDVALHLCDGVFPDVPIRQWVLSLPIQVRFLLLRRPALAGHVLGIWLRVVFGHLRRMAARRGVGSATMDLLRLIRGGAPRSCLLGTRRRWPLPKEAGMAARRRAMCPPGRRDSAAPGRRGTRGLCSSSGRSRLTCFRATVGAASGGQGFQTSGTAEYQAAGLREVFVSWDADWEQTASQGIKAAGCRPATLLRWVFAAPTLHAGSRSTAFCGEGFSGGSGQLGYALAHYGLGDLLDYVDELSGPPLRASTWAATAPRRRPPRCAGRA